MHLPGHLEHRPVSLPPLDGMRAGRRSRRECLRNETCRPSGGHRLARSGPVTYGRALQLQRSRSSHARESSRARRGRWLRAGVAIGPGRLRGRDGHRKTALRCDPPVEPLPQPVPKRRSLRARSLSPCGSAALARGTRARELVVRNRGAVWGRQSRLRRRSMPAVAALRSAIRADEHRYSRRLRLKMRVSPVRFWPGPPASP